MEKAKGRENSLKNMQKLLKNKIKELNKGKELSKTQITSLKNEIKLKTQSLKNKQKHFNIEREKNLTLTDKLLGGAEGLLKTIDKSGKHHVAFRT